MGTYTRGQLPHLTNDILANSSAYKAFQALYLLEISLALRQQDEEALSRLVTVAPAPEISFPQGEIRRCTIDSQDRFRLEFNLLGLYGADSPLPQYFNDMTSRDGDGRNELRAFLDVFNKRLYSLCYLAWKKFNLFADHHGQTSIYNRYLQAISGGAAQQGRFDYAGVLGGRVKSAFGLAITIEDFLGYATRIQENVPVWIPLEQRGCLGLGLQLGDNILLGDQILDVTSKIIISIGPLPMKTAIDLLRECQQARQLAQLIRSYLDPSVTYELDLHMISEPEDQTILGMEHAILGWTCCLGQPGSQANRIRLTATSGIVPSQNHQQTDSAYERAA